MTAGGWANVRAIANRRSVMNASSTLSKRKIDSSVESFAPPGRPKARIAPPRGAANEVSVGVVFAPPGRPKARIAPPREAANEVSVGVVFAPPGRPKARIAPPRGAANEVSVGVVVRALAFGEALIRYAADWVDDRRYIEKHRR